MPTEPQKFSLPPVLHAPMRCKMTVFGSIEVNGQVSRVKDDFIHFVSDDQKFQILVREDAAIVTATPPSANTYHVMVLAGTEIKALRTSGEGPEWVEVGGSVDPNEFKTMTRDGKALRYLDDKTEVNRVWQDPHA